MPLTVEGIKNVIVYSASEAQDWESRVDLAGELIDIRRHIDRWLDLLEGPHVELQVAVDCYKFNHPDIHTEK